MLKAGKQVKFKASQFDQCGPLVNEIHGLLIIVFYKVVFILEPVGANIY